MSVFEMRPAQIQTDQDEVLVLQREIANSEARMLK
jgi:hypothetical protein